MNDTGRHAIIFGIITGTGTALIFLNLPLLFILVLEAITGFLLLVLLSPDFGSELKASVPDFLKISFIRREKREKPLFKITEQKRTGQKKPDPSFVIEREEKTPFSVRPLVSSIRDMITRLATRKTAETKPPYAAGRKPEGKAGGNVDISALALAGELSGDQAMPGRTARGGTPAPVEDPFLSLSSDELETGLLDNYEEPEPEKEPVVPPETMAPLEDSPPVMDAVSGITIGESDIPPPPQEVSVVPEEDANAEEPEPDAYYGFEGTDAIDQNLGEFEDAWTGELEMGEGVPPGGTGPGIPDQIPSLEPVEEVAEAQKPVPGPVSGSPPVPSPAGGALPDQSRAQAADMAIFTAPVSADDEMVRSLASDIKSAKKTKDASLLRELKGFNAPAKDIEGELNEIFSELNAAGDKKTKTKPS